MTKPTSSGRNVVGTAFQLLKLIAALEPVRLVDLTVASQLPKPSVHRMLTQLISVDAVARDGITYMLGPAVLKLGEQATFQELREVARRPLAELAAGAGVGVALTGSLGEATMVLDSIDARGATGYLAGYRRMVPRGSAMAAVHGLDPTARFVLPDLAVDNGGVDPEISCASCAVLLPTGRRAAVTVIVRAPRMPHTLTAELRAVASGISVYLGTGPVAASPGRSEADEQGSTSR